MTSRERILSAINQVQPDLVPVDFGATPSSGISAIAYNNLKQYTSLGLEPTRVYDVIQQLAQPEEALLDFFGTDVIDIGRVVNQEPADWQDCKLPDGSDAQYPSWFNPYKEVDDSLYARNKSGKVIARMPNGATFFDQLAFPYVDGFPQDYSNLDKAMEEVMWAAFPITPWDKSDSEDFWPMVRKKTLELREQSDKALIVGVGCNLFEWGTFLRRMDLFLMDLLTDPVSVGKMLDALMEMHLSTLEKVCKWLGDVVDMIKFGDDLGMSQGPFMSSDTYKTLFKPRHKLLCEYVKKNSSMHTYLHSCGSIYQLLPDLIDAGFEIINPVQTNTANMDPEQLKKEFGKDITFWGGGVETASVLNNGTSEEVRRQVLDRLEIFSPGGGYVFNTIHNILPDVPPENIVAMVEAVREFNGM